MSTTSCTRRTKCVTMGNPCNINELDFQPVFEVPNEPIIVINGVPDVTQSQTTGALDIVSNQESDDTDDDPCFGNWLEGRKVQKFLQNKFYLGKVMKYNENKKWYRVVYKDGGSEDLKWEELEKILVPLDISIPLTTLAAKMCILWNSASGSHATSIKGRKSLTGSSKGKRKTSEPAQISHNQTEHKNIHSHTATSDIRNVQALNSTSVFEMNGKSVIVKTEVTNVDTDTKDSIGQIDGCHFVGRNVLKWFGNGHYFGEVKKYNKETKWYTVVYEDGSSEDLEWHELEKLLVPIKTPGPVSTVASNANRSMDLKPDKPRKMRVNRLGGKKKTNVDANVRLQIQSVDAMQTGSLIESIDTMKSGSLIDSIDTMKTELKIESMDAMNTMKTELKIESMDAMNSGSLIKSTDAHSQITETKEHVKSSIGSDNLSGGTTEDQQSKRS